IAVAGFAILAGVIGLAWARNPLWNSIDLGAPFANLLLLAYLLPACLFAILERVTLATRPPMYRMTVAAAAVTFAFLYLSLEVARFHPRPVLSASAMSDAELYTHSAVWLPFGATLLLAGIALASQHLRLASAAMVAITIGKVFLIDLAGLTGGFRALSFIGLG